MKSITSLSVCFSIIVNLAFSLHAGVYVWYLRHHGLSPIEFNLVNGAFYCASFLLEVPTGHIADRYGRKISCAVGYFASALGLIVYGMSHEFFGFMAAEIIIAIGFACISGSFDAWAIETAQARGENIVRMQWITDRVRYPSLVIGTFIGGYLTSLWTASTWYIGGMLYFVLFVLAVHYMNGHAAGRVSEKEMPTLAEIRALKTTNPLLWSLCIMAALYYYVVSVPNMFWQPMMELKGFAGPRASSTIISIGFAVAFGSTFIPRIASRRLMYICLAALGTIIVVLPLSWGVVTPVVFFATQVPRSILQPMIGVLSNKYMGDFPRATGLSIVAMFGKIGGFVGLILGGACAEVHLPGTWILFGLIAFGVSVKWLYRVKE